MKFQELAFLSLQKKLDFCTAHVLSIKRRNIQQDFMTHSLNKLNQYE